MRWTMVCVVAVASGAVASDAEARARGGRGFFSPSKPAPAQPAPPPNARPGDRGGFRPGLVVLPGIRPSSGPRDIPTGSVGAIPAAAGGAVLGGGVLGGGATARPAAPPREPCSAAMLVGQGAGFCSVN